MEKLETDTGMVEQRDQNEDVIIENVINPKSANRLPKMKNGLKEDTHNSNEEMEIE